MGMIPNTYKIQKVLEDILSALGGATVSTTSIKNIVIANLDTEETIALQANLKQIMIRNRTPNNAILKIAFTATESGTKYITIPSGNNFFLDKINLTSSTLYIQSNKDNTTVEILEIT